MRRDFTSLCGVSRSESGKRGTGRCWLQRKSCLFVGATIKVIGRVKETLAIGARHGLSPPPTIHLYRVQFSQADQLKYTPLSSIRSHMDADS